MPASKDSIVGNGHGFNQPAAYRIELRLPVACGRSAWKPHRSPLDWAQPMRGPSPRPSSLRMTDVNAPIWGKAGRAQTFKTLRCPHASNRSPKVVSATREHRGRLAWFGANRGNDRYREQGDGGELTKMMSPGTLGRRTAPRDGVVLASGRTCVTGGLLLGSNARTARGTGCCGGEGVHRAHRIEGVRLMLVFPMMGGSTPMIRKSLCAKVELHR